jgi:6-phosphogluconolactonase
MTGATTLAQQEAADAVYTTTNAPNGKSVLVFSRSAQRELALVGSLATGGLGTGTGLGKQGGLILSSDSD